jgi:hypothetical protein
MPSHKQILQCHQLTCQPTGSFTEPQPTMSSSPAGSIRQRAGKDKKRPVSPNPEALSEKVANVVAKGKPYKPVQQGREWDYKLAITIMTALAFITRFWGIRHPDQVVFDEVHFGKVCLHVQKPHRLSFGRNGRSSNFEFKANRFHSLLLTTCNAPTSSMSTLLSASFSLLLLVGSLATMANFSSRTLVTRTSPTRSRMSRTVPCPPRSAPSLFLSSL